MATRRAARSRWERGGGGAGRREPAAAASPASPASPAVLSLSHFCRSPFVSFGDVRVGASRTRPLLLLNPHDDAAEVHVRVPAADLGFSVEPRRCELQPKEKIVISVTWTPVKEGRVREIVTFVVNDILKHQAILLGNAEEQKKKKKSLWDTISKKKIPVSSTHHKRISNTQNINETFNVSQKGARVRSPLQACENLTTSEDCSPTKSNALALEENKIPISPISPAFKECHGETCLPLFLRRSTAYSSLPASENGEQVEGTGNSKDFHFNEKVITETCFNSINIPGSSQENGKLICTPNCSSTLNFIQSQGHFISPDSFVKNSQAANDEPGLMTHISANTFAKDSLKPVCLESKILPEICQAILSPDSFVKDNYGLNQDLQSGSIRTILSPSQFVKDNMPHVCISQQTGKPLANESSKVLQCSQDWEENGVLLRVPERQHSKTPKEVFEEVKPVETKSNYSSCTEQTRPAFSAVQDVPYQGHNKQPKKRPILTATVVKRKPTCARENRTDIPKPQTRRCLNSVVGECEKVLGNQRERETLLHLPVIPVIDPGQRKLENYTHEITPLAARKRKSDGSMGDLDGKDVLTQHSEECDIKRIHFSPSESKTSTVRKDKKVVTPVSKHSCSREKLSVRKKSDSLVFKTPISKTSKRRKRIIAVAQSNLTFIKPLKTAMPRHPMPFAAKNMFYDERWKEKQEQGFTWWLNFILTPDDFTVKTSVSEVNAATLLLGVENPHKVSVPKAPTKEEVSLRAYTARCRLNRLRRMACCLFTSENMVKAIKRLEIEIEAGRLLVRKDRHLWKDVGERQKVLNWLLSYNPLWLRIGLETIYGELISLEDNSDVLGLAVFILNRLLWNPEIAAEYRHPTVPHLYRDGHEEALSKFTLKKLLLLVCFLDHAKISRLIDHDPCLFCKDAEFKASKDILLAFSRDFLSGEGDLSRHLSLLGFPVSHVQMPFDEFDFAVTNLAVDLQCGVRLVRTMELLTQNWNLSKKLRIPAISRLQKMHNVDIVLQVLKSRGIQLSDEHGNPIFSKDIVDRHREKTLALLWKIACAFQVDISLNLEQLREEIDFLKHTHSIRKAISALSCYSDATMNKKKDKRNSAPLEQYSDSVKLLMEWVNAVCAFYNKKVENFTVSFSDGRVLCYLIHHYHPCYLPLDAVCQRTTQTVECMQTGSVVLNSSSECDDSILDVSFQALDHENASELHKELLENEKKNFRLVTSAARDLGGIPAMIHHSDMSNTIPDEKVVITYLSFLCARLLDLRKEIRAARLIQTAWRKHKLKKDLKHYKERDKAARIIQKAVINFLSRQRWKKEVTAALVLQKCWRRVLAQRQLLILKEEKLEKIQNASATIIQAYWRRYSTRKRFLSLKYYSVFLQSRIRMIIAVTSYKRKLWAIVTIQRHWCACVQRRRDQQRYKMLKSASLVIQSMFRRWKRRKVQQQVKAAIILQRAVRKWHVRKQAREKSAIIIQSWYRMHRQLKKYAYTRSCIVVIQRTFRCFQDQKLYKRKKASALTLQNYFRAYLKGKAERTSYLQKQAAAIRLQSAFRRMKARHLHRQVRAACVLQSYWRMRQDRLCFLSFRQMVIKLQACVRRNQQLQKYKKMKRAAIIIQTHFQACVSARRVRASYQKTRSAVIVLQSTYRALQTRNAFLYIRKSVIKIQSYFRAYISRKKFLILRNTTIKLQSIVRMKQARGRYAQLKAAALSIQRRYRSERLAACRRREYLQVRESCVKLQALCRGWLARKQMRMQRKAVVVLQSYFRMRKMRQCYLYTYSAVLLLQIRYRAYRAQVNQRKKFLRVRRAAVCLQAAYRGYRARQLIKQQSVAAVKIQTAFRGYSKRVKYQLVLQSAVKIQRWHRACKAARDLRTWFLKTRVAAIALQSGFRGWRVRKQIRKEHQAAVKIQSGFRMIQAQRQFKSWKRAAVVIQRHLRAWRAGRQQRRAYVELHRAVLVLQAAWRGWALRREVQRWHTCAILIQSCYRMHAQHSQWKTIRKAALLIQTCYRAYRLGKEQHRLYLKTKAAAVTLQSAYRGAEVRKRIKDWNRAAITIQSKYRAYKAQKKYITYRSAAVVIQRWYRNIKIANQQRKGYLNLKKTVMKIQAVYRGTRVRQQIQHMHRSATCIQAMFKMHQSRSRYHAMRRAAVVIQVRFRAYHEGKTQRAKYLRVLKAIGILQARFRGARVRQAMRKRQMAATKIQSHYRRYRQQMYYTKLKKVTQTVQQRYRAVKEGRRQFQRYSRLRRSAVLLQAAGRGMMARRYVKAMHSAATLIQRRFRTLMVRRKFLCLQKTVIWVQRKYRANLLARYQLQQFMLVRRAVIQIQSSYRGWIVRKKVREMHKAAMCIQAAFRMHRACVRYRALKRASAVIQKQHRANRAAKRQRQRFITLRRSAVILQAAFRATKVRRHVKEMHLSATLIQYRFRSFLMRRRFISLKRAAVFVQRKYRAKLLARHQLQQFLLVRRAVIQIQSSYRGWIVRKKVREMHKAATCIQAAFRMHRACVRYRALKRASAVIQKQHRANRAAKRQRQRFITLRRSAVILQAAFRALKARRHVKEMHLSATLIQSRFRSFVMRRRFISLKRAAVFVQRKYRATIYARCKRHQFLELRKAAISIQSSYRRLMVKKKLQNMHRAALLIQATFRMHTMYVVFQQWKHASILIQQHYRTYRAAKMQRENFTRRWHSAVVIQAAYRGMKARQLLKKKYRAAVIIQSTYRMSKQYCFYQKVQWATRVIQEHYRTSKKQKALQFQASCTDASFQDMTRRKQAEKEHEAAVVIQKYFKACKTRRRYLCLRAAVISVQRRYRASAAAYSQAAASVDSPCQGLKETEYPSERATVPMQSPCPGLQAQERAALRIQSFLRMAVHRTSFLRQRRAAVTLQQCFRTWKTRKQFLLYRKAVLVLQNHYRAFLSTKHQRQVYLQTRSRVIMIQAGMRRFVQKRKFQKIKTSAIKIQAAWRRYKAKKYVHEVNATCKIQAWYRGWRTRREYLAILNAVKIVQRYFHAKQERTRFLKMRVSVVIIQRKWRAVLSGRVTREQITGKSVEQKARIRLLPFTAAAFFHLSALRIQRAYRRHRAVRSAEMHVDSVICIQRWFRKKMQQKRLIEIEHEVQERLKHQNRAASVIQKAVRQFLLCKRQEKLNSRIIKIQALWRGYSLRKKNDCKKIKAIRLSLQAVNQEIREEDKLYKRTALALHYLSTSKHLSVILEALKHLEVVTRLSPLCCENMANGGAVSKIFVLIRSCNRSVPCMEVIRYAIQVLLHVAKYEKTTSAVYEVENCVDTLLELLQMYREKPGDKVADKSGSIFTKTCCLLAVLLKARNRASDVRIRSKVVDCIYSIYKLTARKHKMNIERIPSKQKKSASVCMPLLPETPMRTRIVSRLEPAWVLRRDNMDEVKNSLQAIQMLMDTLGIPY
ncbi:abnormal spindle-like microcephaly-associated protein [Dipodomys merriami]|uniref:abnormal spindle-like microcephaly-associated protein n=1 Tax=Dipodomys merriami TaxID=94247 RepID=UPI0038556F37